MRTRYRRLIVCALFPALVVYLVSLLYNVPERPSTKVTFKWKSRVRLQGHENQQWTLEKQEEEEKQLLDRLAGAAEVRARRNEQVDRENGERGREDGEVGLGRSAGSQGLLEMWRRNQKNVLDELQTMIKNEVGTDMATLSSLIQRSLVAPSRGPLKTSHGVRMTLLSDTVDRLLGSSTKGFFVEASAYDGEGSSHTLWLEKVRGWTGVLVEPDPAYFLQLLGKNRRAWAVNAALSPSDSPALVVLEDGERQMGAMGGATSGGSRMLVPAYPIRAVLRALNQTQVDFLFLDVGGDEWTILQTIPWNDISVSVIAVGVSRSPVGAPQFVELLTKHGYRCYNKPEPPYRKYVTTENYVLCNKEDPDTYFYQDEMVHDFD